MKSEKLIYTLWSKGFLINKQFFKKEKNILMETKKIPLLNKTFIKLFIERLEINRNLYLFFFKDKTIPKLLTKRQRFVLNIIFFNFMNVNFAYNLLKKYILLRFLLIKSYKGKAFFIHKPVNGQRTWSNKQNAKKLNFWTTDELFKTLNVRQYVAKKSIKFFIEFKIKKKKKSTWK